MVGSLRRRFRSHGGGVYAGGICSGSATNYNDTHKKNTYTPCFNMSWCHCMYCRCLSNIPGLPAASYHTAIVCPACYPFRVSLTHLPGTTISLLPFPVSIRNAAHISRLLYSIYDTLHCFPYILIITKRFLK